VKDCQCSECGARYSSEGDSCAHRFEQLLALDHSRREPWGSRHGHAFAAYALSHPGEHARSLDTAWESLWRIYRLNESPAGVFASVRARKGKPTGLAGVPPRPSKRQTMPKVTIADLGEFSAETYAEQLDDWCRAALESWSTGS